MHRQRRIGAVLPGISASQSTIASRDGTEPYVFGAGDLASRTTGAQTATFQYDQLGNLLDATLADGTAIAYVVDGLGRRVGKKVNGTLVRRFLYADSLRVIAELDGTNSVTTRFIYADSTTPVAMIKGGTTFRIVSDDVGSVRLVVDSATGAIAQRLDYDSFGNVTQDTNPGFQPFAFAGGLYDRDTGLVRFGNRDYVPATGRWTTKDTIWFAGNDTNLYRYVRNDPVIRNDPSGAAPPPDLEDKTDEIPIVQTLIEQDAIIDQKVLSDRARRRGQIEGEPIPFHRES